MHATASPAPAKPLIPTQAGPAACSTIESDSDLLGRLGKSGPRHTSCPAADRVDAAGCAIGCLAPPAGPRRSPTVRARI